MVPLSPYSIHIDGHIGMIAPDLALIDPLGLPWWFVDRLHELGIETVPCVPDEEWAINSLTLAPRRVLMCEGFPHTIDRLSSTRRRGGDGALRGDPEGRRRGALLHDGAGARDSRLSRGGRELLQPDM